MGTENFSGPVSGTGLFIGMMICGLLLLLMSGSFLLPCTVVSIDTGGFHLGGTNEDWEDSRTLLTVIPPETGKYGWVRFSYKSRFPQGGMNEHGLWWDATGVPFLEMPESEVGKTEFFGPLMEKVMEECRTVQEAVQIFRQYYCNDQYRAQYLIGDASGDSVVIEGDTHIRKKGSWQMITNFYHSFPELGGYPCSRYSAAVEVIGSCSSDGVDLVRKILAASVQSGEFPTRYSLIFNPVESCIYVFNSGNFEEFIRISTATPQFERYREWDIPLQFSNMMILSPAHGYTAPEGSVTVSWTGEKESQYELVVSEDASFRESFTSPAGGPVEEGNHEGMPPSMLLAGLLFSGKGRRRGRMLFLIIIVSLFVQTCAVGPDTEEDTSGTFTEILEGLTPGTTYCWKIIARGANGDFATETVPRRFTLAAEAQQGRR